MIKKLIYVISLFSFFILITQSCNIIKKEKPKTELEQKFDSIDIETLKGKKIPLLKYLKNLDSLKTSKPIVLYATYTKNKSAKKIINEVLEYKKKNQDFEIVTLFLDQIDSLKYSSKIKNKDELLQKINATKLKTKTILDVDGMFHKKISLGNNYDRAYIVKNDSLVFNNLGLGTTNFENWGKLLVDALSSKEKLIKNKFKFNNGKTQATYAFKDLKATGSWDAYTYKRKPFLKRNFVNGKLEGEHKQYYINGNLRYINNFKNGKKTDIAKYYYENGSLSIVGFFNEDSRDGEWNFYYENGNLENSLSYLKGKLNGVRKKYYENGSLEIYGQYKEDNAEGVWKTYFDNGKIKSIQTYLKNKLEGEWKTYYKNGNLNEQIFLKDNKRDGNYKKYYENGNLQIAGKYINGKEEGLWKNYYPKKNLESFGNYVNGKREGEWKYYHENKVLHQIGSYKNGLADGEWRIYHKTKKLYQKRLWKDDRMMDIISCFNNRGKKLNKGTLINGNGTVRYYEPRGKLKQTILYKEGVNWKDAKSLNSFAWNYYENKTNISELKQALNWSKRSISLDYDSAYLDTYTALLYKTNQPKLAFKFAKKAINQAIKKQLDYSATINLIKKYSKK